MKKYIVLVIITLTMLVLTLIQYLRSKTGLLLVLCCIAGVCVVLEILGTVLEKKEISSGSENHTKK